MTIQRPFGGKRKVLAEADLFCVTTRGRCRKGDTVEVTKGDMAGRRFLVDERFGKIVYVWQEVVND